MERRRAQRLNIPLRVKCYLPSGGKIITEEVLAKNISGTGIGLSFKRPLNIGSRFKTLFYLPNDQQPISSVSEVVWCKKQIEDGKIYFDVGIEHNKISAKDKEKFVFLFCETMINYSYDS